MEAASEEVVTPVPRPEGKYRFDGLADSPVAEELANSRIRPTHCPLSVRVENIMREKIASNKALEEDAVIRLFDNAGRATKSSPETNEISVNKKGG